MKLMLKTIKSCSCPSVMQYLAIPSCCKMVANYGVEKKWNFITWFHQTRHTFSWTYLYDQIIVLYKSGMPTKQFNTNIWSLAILSTLGNSFTCPHLIIDLVMHTFTSHAWWGTCFQEYLACDTLCYKNFFANVLIFEEMRMKDFIFDSKKIDFVW